MWPQFDYVTYSEKKSLHNFFDSNGGAYEWSHFIEVFIDLCISDSEQIKKTTIFCIFLFEN